MVKSSTKRIIYETTEHHTTHCTLYYVHSKTEGYNQFSPRTQTEKYRRKNSNSVNQSTVSDNQSENKLALGKDKGGPTDSTVMLVIGLC